LKDLEKSILSTFVPNMIPTFAAPIVDQFANRSLFTGAPLIPAAQEKMLPEYQYTEYTTELAKAIGQIMGAFPWDARSLHPRRRYVYRGRRPRAYYADPG
jgi:hypothetical protein